MKSSPNTKATAHTPTPWEVEGFAVSTGETGICIKELGADDTICDVYSGHNDAAFIVRACNAHADLVAALQGVLRVADRNTDEFNAARAALAKAGAA